MSTVTCLEPYLYWWVVPPFDASLSKVRNGFRGPREEGLEALRVLLTSKDGEFDGAGGGL